MASASASVLASCGADFINIPPVTVDIIIQPVPKLVPTKSYYVRQVNGVKLAETQTSLLHGVGKSILLDITVLT